MPISENLKNLKEAADNLFKETKYTYAITNYDMVLLSLGNGDLDEPSKNFKAICHYNLAMCYANQKNWFDCISQIEYAMKYDKELNNKEKVIDECFFLTECYIKKNDLEKAEALYQSTEAFLKQQNSAIPPKLLFIKLRILLVQSNNHEAMQTLVMFAGKNYSSNTVSSIFNNSVNVGDILRQLAEEINLNTSQMPTSSIHNSRQI